MDIRQLLGTCKPQVFETTEAQDQKKLISLGYPEAIVTNQPEFARFLVRSGLAYQIAMLHNSFEGEAPITADSDGHPLIIMNGIRTRWEEIAKLIDYDEKQDALVAKHDPAIGYNYVFPEGIVEKHPAKYDAIYPVGQLSEEKRQELLKHAELFWQTNENPSPLESKPCVLQIVTTRRDLFGRNWLTENILDNLPEHVYVRLVDEKGKVYSFGMRMPPEESNQVYAKLPFTYLTTASSNITCPDYEETRKFQERRVTSVPLSEAAKNEILSYVQKTNGKGVSFNYAKQNCSKLAQVILRKAGIRMNTRLTFGKLIYRLLPSPSRLPGIGLVFKAANKVTSLANSLFKQIRKVTPKPIRHAVREVKKIVSFLPNMLTTLFNNTLAIILGGLKRTGSTSNLPKCDHRMNDSRLSYFPRLFNKVSDFFSHEKSHSYFSPLMVDWQLKQASTRIYTYEKPKMYL